MREPSNRRSPALVLAASALGLTFAAPMTAWANEAAERLTERLDPLENYHATFEQQILDGGGERLQSARGEMWLSRPGMLRWEVEAPYSQTVVSDGEDVYLYDPDLEQVTVQAMDDRVTHTPALLLSGSADELTASYDVFYEQQDGDDVFFSRYRAIDYFHSLCGIDAHNHTGSPVDLPVYPDLAIVVDIGFEEYP